MMPILAKREFELLQRADARIDAIMAWPEARFYAVQEEVSLWSPAQQVHHLALVGLGVAERMATLYEDDSQEILRDGGPNRNGWMVLTFSHIPRGRGKTPARFDAPPEVTRPEVKRALTHYRQKLAILAPKAQYFYDLKGRLPHPMLGNFNILQWLKFARVHALHHINIADDIGARYGSRAGQK